MNPLMLGFCEKFRRDVDARRGVLEDGGGKAILHGVARACEHADIQRYTAEKDA